MNEFDTPLSPQSLRRQAAILQMARGEARRRRRRRVAGNAAVAGVLLIASASIFRWQFMTGATQSQKPSPIAIIPPAITPAPMSNPPGVVVEYIHTDPTIAARLSIPHAAPRWQVIDDDALLKSMADAGQPAGIIRMGGRSILMVR